MTGEAKVIAFLIALERALTPPRGQHHVLFASDYNTESGWQPCLFLQVAARQPVEPIQIQDGDLAKPIEQLVDEVTALVLRADHRAAKLREFDERMGDAR